MKQFMIGLLAIGCLTVMACNNAGKETDAKEMADDKNDKKMEVTKVDNDADFVTAVADGGMLEVKLGELAQSKSGSALVKDLAKMLVNDHTKANNELAEAARKNNITMATGLSSDNQAKYDDMAAKSGVDFDKAYTALLKSAHEKTIGKLDDEIANGHNADVKAWATATLPVIKHHSEMVVQVHDKVHK